MFSRFTTVVALLAATEFLLVDDALALKVPVRKHRHRKGAAARNNTVSARQTNPEPIDLDNVFDLYYSTNITIAGQELDVQLDTGSSELWVRAKQPFPVSQVTAFNNSLSIRYGIGNFEGTMTRANVTLGDANIPNQYFLNYTRGQINNVFQAGLDGMLGLGFDDGSSLRKLVNRTTNVDNGHTLLTNFFTANPGLPRTMSFFMGRNNDPLSDDDDGVFMLGQPEPEFAAVATGPAFPVHLNTGVGDFQRWSLYVDAFEVNGTNVTGVRSVVPGVSDGSLVANIDTGTSLAWVPRAVADAIYKNIPGVQYSEATSLYTVPCMQTVRLAIWIDGHRYPIHPMDITRVQSRAGASGKTEYFCTNTFMYSAALAQQSRELDMQLGDTFLRNVLAQYDFGNPADHSTANIRLVSTTTDELAALNAFNQQRSEALGISPVVTELPGLPSGATASSTQIGTTTPANRPPDSTSAASPGSSPSAPGGGDAGSSQNPDDGSSIHLPSVAALGIGLVSSLLALF